MNIHVSLCDLIMSVISAACDYNINRLFKLVININFLGGVMTTNLIRCVSY